MSKKKINSIKQKSNSNLITAMIEETWRPH